MKVKRFVAEDMRTALGIVKEELGADAVILSNRKVNGKVEILAAMDYDEGMMNDAIGEVKNKQNPDSAAAYFEKQAAERYPEDQVTLSHVAQVQPEVPAQKEQQIKEELPQQVIPQEQLAQQEKPQQVVQQESPQLQPEPAHYADHQASGLHQSLNQSNHGITEMRDELKSLRAMIENQQAMSEWKELAKKHPLRISLYKRLTQMGLSQDVCKYLAKGLDDLNDIEQAMQAALKQLVHQLPIANDDIINQGGVYAMVGPTGVGKTTTIAKLAARFAMHHGQRHVALISTDNYRIGAHEQLMTYGRLLGVPVHTANNEQELQQLLHKLYDKKLILIDTAGMSQRDVKMSEKFTHLGSNSSIIKSYLVLAANAQLATLDEAIKSFKKANLAGCILTKLDEAVSLGGVLSAMIKHHLPAAYVSGGQRVPEDLQPARARELINESISHMKQYRESSDEDFMAASFSSETEQVVGH
jgi:flagellar biosynthesis protein FlhF